MPARIVSGIVCRGLQLFSLLVAVTCSSSPLAVELNLRPGAKPFDPETNKIDRMIRIRGFACAHIPNMPKACEIEIDLDNYIKTMPPNPDDIGRELATLGAICDQDSVRLRCVYERTFDDSEWIAAGSTRKIKEEYLRFDIRVFGKDDTLAVDVHFNRTTTYRNQTSQR